MGKLKKLLSGIFCLILLISIIFGALAISVRHSISSKASVINYVNNSNLYNTFVNQESGIVKKSVDSSSNATTLDSYIEASLESAFPKANFNNNVSLIVDNNYDWLEGKINKPNFSINLTENKLALIGSLKTAIEGKINNLPKCTIEQTLTIDTAHYLTDSCNPEYTSNALLSQTVIDIIGNVKGFIKNPVINANSLKTSSLGGSPYYSKLRKAPAIYRDSKYIPEALALISLFSIFIVVMSSSKKRRGLKKVCFVLMSGGIMVTVTSILFRHLSNKIADNLSGKLGLGAYKSVSSSVLSKMAVNSSKILLYFGIVYIIMGVILLLILSLTRRTNRSRSRHKMVSKNFRQDNKDDQTDSMIKLKAIDKTSSAYMDVLGAPTTLGPKARRLPSAPMLEQKEHRRVSNRKIQ